MKTTNSNEQGIGLVEVMITLVVIAFGLVAIAAFQGRILSETRQSQSYADLRMECEAKINLLRPAMTKSDFSRLYSALFPDADTLDPADTSEDITVTCSDTDGNQVSLSTTVTLHDGVTGALGGTEGSGSNSGLSGISPSLNAGSSDDISERISLTSLDGEVVVIEADRQETYTAGDFVTGSDGNLYIVDDTLETASATAICADEGAEPFENGLYARRGSQDSTDLFYKVYLYEATLDADGTAYCTARVRYNGGVIIPISGVIHSGDVDNLDIDLFTFNITESGTYCVFEPNDGATSAPYTCYVGGNCNNNNEDTTYGNDTADYKRCPQVDSLADEFYAAALAILNDDEDGVGEGGWRGRVGLLNVASNTGSGGYSVCFDEELQDPDSVDYAVDPSLQTRDTARSYTTLAQDSNSRTRAQGLNKPYTCQDFLVIDSVPSGQGYDGMYDFCSSAYNGISGVQLASKTILRDMSAQSSVPFEYTAGTDSCRATSYATVTGTISGNIIGVPLVKATGTNGTVVCDTTDQLGASDVDYSCTVDTRNITVSITLDQDQKTYPEALDNDSLTLACANAAVPLAGETAGADCDITLPAAMHPEYIVSGPISGDSDVLDRITIIDGVYEYLCSVAVSEYTCSFSTAPSTSTSTSEVTLTTVTTSALSTATIGTPNPITLPITPTPLPEGVTEVTGPTVTVSTSYSNYWKVTSTYDFGEINYRRISTNPDASGSFCYEAVDGLSSTCYIPLGNTDTDVEYVISSTDPDYTVGGCTGGNGANNKKIVLTGSGDITVTPVTSTTGTLILDLGTSLESSTERAVTVGVSVMDEPGNSDVCGN